jgi:protein-S-isoprenylcysteine O-methyltransferase Ste14
MNISRVQTIRKIVLLAAIAVAVFIFAVTDTIHPSGHTLHEMIEWLGLLLIVICILGRTWSSLYIAGRKGRELVTNGPYSTCRNPLYFFSIIGAAGMGAQSGSIVIGVICGAIASIVFYLVVTQEERLLVAVHGKPYRAYLAKVPRFIPRPGLWHDNKTLTIEPPRVLMTFADALVFLLAVPIAEGFEYLRDIGTIPTLLVLP